jgi:cytochrome c553
VTKSCVSLAFFPLSRLRERVASAKRAPGEGIPRRKSPSPASLLSAPSPRFAGRGESARKAIAVGLALSLSASSAPAASNITAGRQKALQCQTCHGLDGLSKIPDAPNIAGNPEGYLVKSLNAFRKGERKNEMMSIVAQQLSDQDVADLAAYYAAIEVTVKVPK